MSDVFRTLLRIVENAGLQVVATPQGLAARAIKTPVCLEKLEDCAWLGICDDCHEPLCPMHSSDFRADKRGHQWHKACQPETGGAA